LQPQYPIPISRSDSHARRALPSGRGTSESDFASFLAPWLAGSIAQPRPTPPCPVGGLRPLRIASHLLLAIPALTVAERSDAPLLLLAFPCHGQHNTGYRLARTNTCDGFSGPARPKSRPKRDLSTAQRAVLGQPPSGRAWHGPMPGRSVSHLYLYQCEIHFLKSQIIFSTLTKYIL
jgi:hypothetical protein